MNRSLKPKKKRLPRNELDGIKPIPPAELTLEKLHTYSNKKLLVTATYLNKKAQREKDPAQREAMTKIAIYLAQLIKSRIEEAKMKGDTP